MPPLWALGNQQSRYSYYPDTVAEEVVRRYRADDLPLDVLHLDIHFMDEFRVFTWNSQRFPNPKGFTGKLRAQGVKVVTIVDPGIKYQGYSTYDQGAAQDYFLKRKDGRPYIARVWPGDSVFVDYTKDAAARWWGDLHRAYTEQGVAGIWNDMNEPSDFNDQTGKSQMDVVTYDGGDNSSYAKNRNVFALNEAKATYEGLQRLLPNLRPYVITRAGYAGIQRYATVTWSGDNRSTWDAAAGPADVPDARSPASRLSARTSGLHRPHGSRTVGAMVRGRFLTPFCRNHADMASPDPSRGAMASTTKTSFANT